VKTPPSLNAVLREILQPVLGASRNLFLKKAVILSARQAAGKKGAKHPFT